MSQTTYNMQTIIDAIDANLSVTAQKITDARLSGNIDSENRTIKLRDMLYSVRDELSSGLFDLCGAVIKGWVVR